MCSELCLGGSTERLFDMLVVADTRPHISHHHAQLPKGFCCHGDNQIMAFTVKWYYCKVNSCIPKYTQCIQQKHFLEHKSQAAIWIILKSIMPLAHKQDINLHIFEIYRLLIRLDVWEPYCVSNKWTRDMNLGVSVARQFR